MQCYSSRFVRWYTPWFSRTCASQPGSVPYEEHNKHTSVCSLANTLPPPTSQCTTRLCFRPYVPHRTQQSTRNFTHNFVFNCLAPHRHQTPPTPTLSQRVNETIFGRKGILRQKLVFFTLFLPILLVLPLQRMLINNFYSKSS